jgi:hypothetical protein
MEFTKATRKKAKLRLALTGASGSGKTYSALLLATGLGGRIAVIDTERESASLYADEFEFDTLCLEPNYTPEKFIAAIEAAEAAGYDVLVIDSITHEWQGTGGVLELVDHIAKSKFKGNTWAAWNELTPRHRRFLDKILQSSMHVIATMRSKSETAQQEVNGTKKVVKLGTKTEQREGTDFEFTTVLDIVHDGHYAVASKDRTKLFTHGYDPKPITIETGKSLIDWLNSGEDVPIVDENAPITSEDGELLISIAQCHQLETLLAQANVSEASFCKQSNISKLNQLAYDRFQGAADFLAEYPKRKAAKAAELAA